MKFNQVNKNTGDVNNHITDNSTVIKGDVNSATSQDGNVIQTVKGAGGVAFYKSEVDAAPNLDDALKDLLKQAMDAIESSAISPDKKDESKEDLHQLTNELKSATKEPGRISRFFNRIAQVLPPVARILGSGKDIADAMSG